MAKFHKSHYWGSWSRVLSEGVPQGKMSEWFVELDLTPIPSCFSSTWKDIEKVNIRSHCTMRDKRDIETDELPAEVRQAMVDKLGEQLTELLLTEDYLPQIDWELYNKFNNGGAPFERIKKQ